MACEGWECIILPAAVFFIMGLLVGFSMGEYTAWAAERRREKTNSLLKYWQNRAAEMTEDNQEGWG